MSEAPSDGYVMMPSRYDPPFGSPQVDVWLSDSPTDRFFDIHTLRVQPLDSLDWDPFTIGGHEVVSPSRLIPPGRMVMLAPDGDLSEIFSFGCTLNAQREEPYLHCTLTSTAPILDVPTDEEDVGRILVDEITALAARLCAEQSRSADDSASPREGTKEPYALFLAALVALTEDKPDTPPARHDRRHIETQEALESIIASVREKDGWPATIPPFANLCTAWKKE